MPLLYKPPIHFLIPGSTIQDLDDICDADYDPCDYDYESLDSIIACPSTGTNSDHSTPTAVGGRSTPTAA